MRHLPFIALAPLLLLGLAAETAHAQADPPSDADKVRPYVGQWSLTADDPEAQIDRAVAEGTEALGFGLREIARERLAGAIDAERRVDVRLDGEVVVITLGSWGPHRLPLDGRFVRADAEDGTRLQARAMIAHGSLVIEQRTGEGARVVYFHRRGDRLVLGMRLTADRLPRDIVYQLPYGRARIARR